MPIDVVKTLNLVSMRPITAADDAAVAALVRTNLKSFDLAIPGTAYYDPQLEHLREFYQEKPDQRLYLAALDQDGRICGGVGLAEFPGLPNCAEVQKLYLSDAQKGRGRGRVLMETIEACARLMGYKRLYLETHSRLQAAVALYEKLHYRRVDQPCPTEHNAMDRFYLKEI